MYQVNSQITSEACGVSFWSGSSYCFFFYFRTLPTWQRPSSKLLIAAQTSTRHTASWWESSLSRYREWLWSIRKHRGKSFWWVSVLCSLLLHAGVSPFWVCKHIQRKAQKTSHEVIVLSVAPSFCDSSLSWYGELMLNIRKHLMKSVWWVNVLFSTASWWCKSSLSKYRVAVEHQKTSHEVILMGECCVFSVAPSCCQSF